jgi:uncharacterized protein YgfB (UPF0149 family)
MLDSSYQCVDDVLRSHGAAVNAARAHGMLVGMLCLDDGTECAQWLDVIFGEDRAALQQGQLSLVLDLCEGTRRLLTQTDFSFQLFLPDDDAALAARASALSEWCQGFLSVLNYEAGGRAWSSDCDEVLQDLRDVCELDPDVAGEDDENAYMEISEFVRVGVQLIHAELRREPKLPRLH